MPQTLKNDWIRDFLGPYSGSLLAPWANRVDRGRYSFHGQGRYPASDLYAAAHISLADYQLEVNELDRQNALHGYLARNPMKIEQTLSAEFEASLTLSYAHVDARNCFDSCATYLSHTALTMELQLLRPGTLFRSAWK